MKVLSWLQCHESRDSIYHVLSHCGFMSKSGGSLGSVGHNSEGGAMRRAGHKLWVPYGTGGCAWCKAAVYREQEHFVEIEDMSMGVRGVSAGMATAAHRSAMVVVVRLWLQQWGRREGFADGGVHKGEVRGGGGQVSGQAVEGAVWAAGEGGGTGAMNGCGSTRDRAKVRMGGPGHVGQSRTYRKGVGRGLWCIEMALIDTVTTFEVLGRSRRCHGKFARAGSVRTEGIHGMRRGGHGTSRRGEVRLWWSAHVHGALRDVLWIWARRNGGQTCSGSRRVSGWGLLHGALLRGVVGGPVCRCGAWGTWCGQGTCWPQAFACAWCMSQCVDALAEGLLKCPVWR